MKLELYRIWVLFEETLLFVLNFCVPVCLPNISLQIKILISLQEEMGSISLPDMAVGIIHHCPTAYSGAHWKYDKNLCLGRRPPILRTASKRKKCVISRDCSCEFLFSFCTLLGNLVLLSFICCGNYCLLFEV